MFHRRASYTWIRQCVLWARKYYEFITFWQKKKKYINRDVSIEGWTFLYFFNKTAIDRSRLLTLSTFFSKLTRIARPFKAPSPVPSLPYPPPTLPNSMHFPSIWVNDAHVFASNWPESKWLSGIHQLMVIESSIIDL